MLTRTEWPTRFLAGWLVTFILLGTFFVSILPASAQISNTAIVTVSLNLRGGPSTSYSVIRVLPAGAQVNVRQCNANVSWCELAYAGSVGWAAARYLNFQGGAANPPAPPPQTGGQVTAVTTLALNMRGGPSTSYGVILSIPAGTTVPVNRCTDGYAWCEVQHRGYTGWVAARYLRATAPQYEQQPLPNVGQQLGLALFNFIFSQISGGQQAPATRTPGANQVCFYRDPNFGGDAACVNMGQNDDSLSSNWDDEISSLRVGRNAVVEVCRNDDYRGYCRVYDDDAPTLPNVLDDDISSFRTTGLGGGGPQPSANVCFYADFYLQGASFCLDRGQTLSALDTTWNDRISSIEVGQGVTVQVCRDYGFGGWCEQYVGTVPQLPQSRNDAISSIRTY